MFFHILAIVEAYDAVELGAVDALAVLWRERSIADNGHVAMTHARQHAVFVHKE